jgi:CubicO group peptidase (beta-lactamase class C family)
VAAPAAAPAGLEPMHALMREAVESGRYLGAVTLVSRGGEIVDWQAWGHLDLARKTPMRRDAIFRIYSLTKTIATVAVLVLVEEGKLALDDPVGRHLPGFSGRAVTVRHLLTHTSGLAPARGPIEESPDLEAYGKAAARLAQAAAPGTRFEYSSVNTELASRLVEVAAGMPFEAFLRQRIFVPLGMKDTGFTVPAAERARIAAMTSTDAKGKLIPWPAGDAKFPGDMMRPYASGAGGLYSTVEDFARFAHMLAGGGRLAETRILRPSTVDLMMTNQLTHLDPPVSQYGEGFGLGGFVNLDDPKRQRPGSNGAFGWSGAAGTYYMIDRAQGLVAILFTQHLPRGLPHDPGKLSFRFYNLVYQSRAP